MRYPIDPSSIRKNIVLIAGGIGMTPLFSIFSWVHDLLGDSQLAQQAPPCVWFLHQAVDQEGFIYQKELYNMQAEYPDRLKCYWTITGKDFTKESVPKATNTLDTTHTGAISKTTLTKLDIPLQDSLVYICGPLGMIQSLTDMLTSQLNVKPSQIITEKWTGAPIKHS